jgi:hypothetical protein
MTDPNETVSSQGASYLDGTSFTPPDDDIDLLRSAIAEKVTELEVARISLKEFNFPNEILRSAFMRITDNTAYDVHKLRVRLKALLPPKVPPSDPSDDTSITPDPAAMGTPPRYGSPVTTVPYGSPMTPPGLSALVTTLWHKDFCFSSDKSDLEAILRQAQEPISFDIDPEDPELLDPCLSVDSQLLVTLDPATRTEVLRLAHELRSADILLAQAKIKYELMESDSYIAKIVRVKSKLKPPAEFSKDPLFTTLSSEFTALVRQYQKDGTGIIRRLVNHQVTVYRAKIFPQVIHGLFRLAKQAVVGRRPQNDILDLLQMAHRETNLPELPETNEEVAGYTVLLLLASSSAHVLSHYIGLSEKTGNRILFAKTLELIRDCPTPRRVLEAPATEAAAYPEPAPTPENTFATPKSAAASTQHEVTPSSTADTSVFQSARSLLKSAMHSTSSKAYHSKPNDDDSAQKPAARHDYTPGSAETNTSNEFTISSPPENHRTGAVTVLIGNELFPLPSPACWALAMELHQILKPIANHITMVQRLQLARQLTRSKVITTTRGLQINRDTFTATTSVRELIDRLDVEPHAVISIINGWHRATFRTMEQRLQKRLLQLTPPPHSKPTASPVIEIQDTPPRTASTRKPPPKGDNTRKRPTESTEINSEHTPPGKRAKKDTDGGKLAASLPSSAPPQQQSKAQDEPTPSAQKKPKKARGPPKPPRQKTVTFNDTNPTNPTAETASAIATKRRNKQRQKQRQKQRKISQQAKAIAAAAANDSADA